MDQFELMHRFEYHPPLDNKTVAAHEATRSLIGDLADRFNELLPEGREKALVMTKLEETMFWANASIARNNLV